LSESAEANRRSTDPSARSIPELFAEQEDRIVHRKGQASVERTNHRRQAQSGFAADNDVAALAPAIQL